MIRGLCLLLLVPAQAGAFEAGLPLDCTWGQSCFVQNYVDHDPGPEMRDFTCGSLGYDGHDGSDFALPSLAAMQAGVTVRAVADGVVKGARDGMADILISAPNAPDITGRECGNGVLIAHADGWESQYCHMKQGTVTLQAGDTVAKGAALGQVGASGNTAFPHLHLTLRHNGDIVDPFAPEALDTCGAQGDDLWAPALPYIGGGLIAAGFATEVPEFDSIKSGLSSPATLPEASPALVLWAYIFGGRTDDAVQFVVIGPKGEIMESTTKLEKNQAQLFRATGKKRPVTGWPAGTYSGTATLMRGETTLGAQTITLTIP